jgi:hypothetical protein
MGFDPWRPGSSSELMIVDKDSEIKIVNVETLNREAERTLGEVATTRSTLLNQFVNLVVQRAFIGPSASAAERSPLHELSAVHWIRFDTLGARDKTILGLRWHPSGEYLAVDTGEWHNEGDVRRGVHIVHLRSAQIVASIPTPASALGWSPGGRFLLVKRWRAGSEGRWEAEVGVWDTAHFQVRFQEVDPILSHPWAIHALHSAPWGPGHTYGSTTLPSALMRSAC